MSAITLEGPVGKKKAYRVRWQWRTVRCHLELATNVTPVLITSTICVHNSGLYCHEPFSTARILRAVGSILCRCASSFELMPRTTQNRAWYNCDLIR